MKYLYTIIFVLLYSAFLWLAFWSKTNAEMYTIYADLSQVYWVLCCFAALSAIVCAMLGFIAISQK